MSMPTYFKQSSRAKVHFTEYLKTENKPDTDEKPAEDAQPEPKEAK